MPASRWSVILAPRLFGKGVQMYIPAIPLLLCLILIAVLSACSDGSGPRTPSPVSPSPAGPQGPERATPEPLDGPTTPAPSALTPVPTSVTTTATKIVATPVHLPAPTPPHASVPIPVATPAPVHSALSNEEVWVRDRLDAVVSLYGITPEGSEALRRLDVRWMRDEPGFFGSYGYKGWAGVGEARPIGVMHELSHSYWGLFSVTGFPNLAWDVPEGAVISPGLERYHRDILRFMKQPPDQFELLRSRLRNLPELSAGNTEPLFHTLEADMVYTTAGDLALVPPILRKYWDRFLQSGPFYSWNEAFLWYQALPLQEKQTANKYIGFEHFDLRSHASLKGPEPTELEAGARDILVAEEMQRLRDFVLTFDTVSAFVLGTPERKENFTFWRRYLRDKITLQGQHPELVTSLNLPRSQDIAAALDFLRGISGKGADEKAALVMQELDIQPFLVNFLPALDDLTLRKIFTSDARLPEGTPIKVTSVFVESLERFIPHVERILEGGRQEASRGADELESYLNTVDFNDKEGLGLFFEVLRGSDNDTARAVVAALNDLTLGRLLRSVPTHLYNLLTPARFLEFLNITPDSSPDGLAQGIKDMITHPSGNFRIDEPFLDEMYRVVVGRSRMAPRETLDVVAGSPFPMERFIGLHPAASIGLLSTDIETTSEIVKSSDSVTFHPARFVYRLIHADPEFAALLVEHLDAADENGLVIEALAHFAYDADRVEAVPELPISLEKDGRFLKRLLEDRIGKAVALYEQRVNGNAVSDDFLVAYERTLRAAASRLEDKEAGRTLDGVIDRTFR